MADVQLENGYTKIANEILDQLAKTDLNGTQFKIIMVIFRYTYGYNRKEHDLSVTFISNATNATVRQIKKELNKLIERKIIAVYKEATFSTSRVIGFNKNYNEWIDESSTQGNSKTPGERLDTSPGERLDTSPGERLDTSPGERLDTSPGERLDTSPGERLDTSPGERLDTSPGERLDTQEIKKENIKESSAKILINDFFEDAWKLYPNKKGKSAVTKKGKEAIYKLGIEKMTKVIENYKKELQREKWKQPMNGSTFFNGRYEDYLETDEKEDIQTISMYPDL